jgi:hypothetical protein
MPGVSIAKRALSNYEHAALLAIRVFDAAPTAGPY